MTKKTPKTILHTSHCECEWFFDDKGNCLGYWYLNDAHYRNEYMDPFLLKLGYVVESVEYNDPRVFERVKEDLLKDGFSEEDITGD